MKINRSSKLTIKFATKKKLETLNLVKEEYTRIVNFFIDLFWENNFILTDLTKEIYNLPSSWFSSRLKQCAAREALKLVNTAKSTPIIKKSKDKLEVEELIGEPIFNEPTKPKYNGNKITLSSQIVSIEEGKNSFDLWIKFSSIGNKIIFKIPTKRHKQFNKFYEDDWKLSNSIILLKDCIQVSFEKDILPKKSVGEFIGIDVGINHLLATSKGDLVGNNVKILIDKIKRKKQGSKSYKRAKIELRNYNKQCVNEVFNKYDLGLVVVEKLKNLKQGKTSNRGKSFRKTLSNWNYSELLDFIKQKTEVNRVYFRSVNPYKTSQECPNCNHTQRENRKGEEFKCLHCGYKDQADIVGSLNILKRCITGVYSPCLKPI
ncbi:MAG: RNA-guided endonuclease InsQ/TnpB family protein [Nanoarchaeota archaeon]